MDRNPSDLITVLRSYIESVLSNVHEMKVLLFDNETAQMASLVYTQSELLQREVVLIEMLQTRLPKPVDDALCALQCVCVLRPTEANLHDLCSELNCPHFNSYYIFFTNVVQKDWLRQIAFADHGSKVFVLHEIYIDVLALNRRLFSLGIAGCLASSDNAKRQRIVDGLFSVLCAFKVKASIRFDSTSRICEEIGARLGSQIAANPELFQSTTSSALVLLLDRRTDPITPLLHGWSYVGLVHESLGLKNNVVTMRSDPSKSIVLDERIDDFFATNLFTNYGLLGDALNGLTQRVKTQHIDVKAIKDVDGLKKFIHNYPNVQKQQAAAAKHAGVLTEISSVIQSEELIRIAPIEQQIATQNDQSGHLQAVLDMIRDPKATDQNALRFAMLYALHYESDARADLDRIKQELSVRQRGDALVQTLERFVGFAGERTRRHEPLFAAKSLLKMAQNLIGLEKDKFALYQPALGALIQKLAAGVRKDAQFATMFQLVRNVPDVPEPKKIIVFYVGGITYEEARLAYEAAVKPQSGVPPLDIIVGGTTVHNMQTFVQGEILNDE